MKKCKNCGITFDEGEVYCNQCGTKLEPVSVDERKSPGDHKGVYIAVIVAIIAVAAVAIGAIVYFGAAPKNDSSSISASQPAVVTKGSREDSSKAASEPSSKETSYSSNTVTSTSSKENELEAAYAKNPSSVQNIDQKTHNRSEYAELTGVVREYEGRHATGTPAVVYTLDLPDSFTVVGTKYGDITSDKIVLPDSLASEYVGKTITLGAQYGARVSTGSPAFNISHVHALWTDDTQPEIIRTFD